WVSYLPRAASVADAARHDRCAGWLALQIALSETGAARPEAGRQAGPGRAGNAARRRAAWLPDGTRGSAGRCRRPAAAHRQGLLVGGPDRRAWVDAHADRQWVEWLSLPVRHAVLVLG